MFTHRAVVFFHGSWPRELQVNYLKHKGVTWFKMIFWMPWDKDIDEFKAAIPQVEQETGLRFVGFVSGVSEATTHRALDLLEPLCAGALVWLQIPPESESEDILPYSISRDESGNLVSKLMSLCLGGTGVYGLPNYCNKNHIVIPCSTVLYSISHLPCYAACSPIKLTKWYYCRFSAM